MGQQEFGRLDDGIILVGHSIGGTIGLYARAIPQAVVRRLTGRDHQLNNDMSEVAADIRRLV